MDGAGLAADAWGATSPTGTALTAQVGIAAAGNIRSASQTSLPAASTVTVAWPRVRRACVDTSALVRKQLAAGRKKGLNPHFGAEDPGTGSFRWRKTNLTDKSLAVCPPISTPHEHTTPRMVAAAAAGLPS